MKSFCIYILLWTGLFFLGISGLDYIITSGLKQVRYKPKYTVWNDIYNGDINADVLIIGSSRAVNHYDTHILDSLLVCHTYNLGISGHFIDMQVIRYMTYVRFNNKPKLVLLNVDFFSTLACGLDEYIPPELEREQFFPYIVDDILIDLVKDKKGINWKERYLPLYRYVGYKNDILLGLRTFIGFQEEKNKFYKGFFPIAQEWRNEDIEKKIDLNISDSLYEVLNDFILNLQKNGVCVIMVKSPIHQSIQERFNGKEIMDSFFLSYSEENNIPLLDYSDLNNDTTFYSNPTHLNEKGAKCFTYHLVHGLDSIGLVEMLKLDKNGCKSDF